MTMGNGMNNFKRVLIIALCSILCVCTVPRFSFRSEAADITTVALRQSIMYMFSYLSSRGYSIAHEYGSSIPSVSELKDMSLDQLGNLYWGIADKLNTFGATHDLPGAGDKFLMQLEIAYRTGALSLSPSLRDTIDWWLSDSTVNGSVNVGSINTPLSDYANDAGFLYSVQFDSSTSSRTSFYFDVPTICFHVRSRYGDDSISIVPSDLSYYQFNALTGIYELPVISDKYLGTYTYQYDGKTYQYYNDDSIYRGSSDTWGSVVEASSLFTNANNAAKAFLRSEFTSLSSGEIVTTQLDDTSESELLTSTNTIASDGTVEGDITIYFPDQATLETAIDGYNQGSISYEDFLKYFGINSVASDATVQEKEDALTVVVTPSEDYLWFTKTQWGAEAIEETRKASASTRAEEDSLADSIASTANGGSVPEDKDNKSRGKGLLALLLLGLGIWNTPIIAGDGTPSGGGTDDDSGDGSGDTSGYLAESIAGMAIAGSLVDDLFDSAGGSNGYGLIYTVGASFVIFSVIIGAANYFGALFHGSDTKQNIKASGKKSAPGKEKKGG